MVKKVSSLFNLGQAESGGMTVFAKIRALLELFRLELPTAAGICVVLGAVLAQGSLPPLWVMTLGFACGFLLSGSALITNDFFDLEVDRINAPQRVLPSGRVSPRAALVWGLVVGGLGIGLAARFGPVAFGLAASTWALGFGYNWRLKSAGLLGNLIVSSSVAVTFILGGLIVNVPWQPLVWLFAAIVFLFDLAEEIAGDAMDAVGDQQRASRSIALVWGKAIALRISVGLFALVGLLSFVPMFWAGLGWRYFIPIGLMDTMIIIFGWKLLNSQTPAEGRFCMRVMYLSGSLGLLAFLLASFLR